VTRDPDLEDEGMGSGEQLEPDLDEQARRGRFEAAATQGVDQLAGVLSQEINALADEFDLRIARRFEEWAGGNRELGVAPPGFVKGASFGALIFFVSLVASLFAVGRSRDR
jgi:hypothetical protein